MTGESKESGNPNPLGTANIFSKLSFWWLRNLVRYGSKNDLEFKDLYDTLIDDRSEKLSNNLEIVWNNELNRKSIRKPSFTRSLIRVYKWRFYKYLTLVILSCILQLLQPLLLEMVMSYFHISTETTMTEAYIYVTIFVIMMISQILVMNHGLFGLMMIGMQIKTAVSSLMYKKLLRLSSKSASESSGASVITLLTNDVSKFETVCYDMPYLLIFPLQLIVATIGVCQFVGTSIGFIGITLMIVQTLPLQAFMYYVILRIRLKISVRSDVRISLLNEIINSIRAIKMHVWENYFEKLVQIARREEIRYYLKMCYVTSIVYAFSNFAQRLCTFIMILISSLQKDFVSSDKIIPMTSYLSILGEILTGNFFYSVNDIAYVKVSIQRIEEFLLRDETKQGIEKLDCGSSQSVRFENITAFWNEEKLKPAVDDININIAVNELCVIVGSVGSGKSTLLKLILGEIRPVNGNVHVQGRISYASQEPWIFPASIRENIIFGEIYDEIWYEKVIRACALNDDFDKMPYGDKTLVGDRGSNLSGGQRARINMARAVYRKADLYLLDDPLSSVDTRVAELLFENCINGLLKDKTRILVTNNLQYLHKSDQIVLIEKGRIKFIGNYDIYCENNIINHSSISESNDSTPETEINDLDKTTVKPIEPQRIDSEIIEEEPEEIEEMTAKGKISASLYWKYIKASGSYVTMILLIICNILVMSSIAGFDYYLADSTNNEQKVSSWNETINQNQTTLMSAEQQNTNEKLYTFAGLIMIIITCSILRNVLFYNLTLTSSMNIHNKMVNSILRTPLRFFATNPSGRILNRFSGDTGYVDDSFQKNVFDSMDCFSAVTGMLIPVVVIDPWLSLSMIIIGFMYYKMSIIYIKIIQSVKRLEAIARSPVLSLATSSLAGTVTIRSCQVESLVCQDFDSRQDSYMKVYFLVIALQQAFCCWLELLLAVLFAIVAYSCVILKKDDESAGYVGLSLMQILNVTSFLSFMMVQFCEMLARMVNVERMFQFTELEREGGNENKSIQKIPETWPNTGRIKFDHLNLRYSDDSELVLKDLCFTIDPRTKVGIVGRTGAGKSSLIAALFRLTKIDGTLLIDGIDIKNIDLSDLRSKISIIPQEPTLFNASLRENLDPLKEHDDASLWSALENVELNKTFVNLEHQIGQGGSNLSSGQRQLLCLARAIIKKNKILIMDEATANIDLATDEFIQKIIRTKFSDCTILTIAHRLNTIMDSDKILVMDNGRAVEYDHPYLLLQKDDSSFKNLVRKTGYSMSQNLEMLAKQMYEQEHEITRL